MTTLIKMMEMIQSIHPKYSYVIHESGSLQNKMNEEIKINVETITSNKKSDIDWNFILGLLFGIGYLLFASNA